MLDKSLMYLDELAFKIKKAKPDSSVLTQRKLHSKQLLQANLPVNTFLLCGCYMYMAVVQYWHEKWLL